MARDEDDKGRMGAVVEPALTQLPEVLDALDRKALPPASPDGASIYFSAAAVTTFTKRSTFVTGSGASIVPL